MGCLYGGNLARVGASVTMIDVWAEHVAAMNQNGLEMDGLQGEFTAKVSAAVSADGVEPADVAILLTTTNQTDKAATIASRILKDDGFALTLQNGLGNIEKLDGVLGENRSMAGLSFHSAGLRGPVVSPIQITAQPI